MNSVPVALSFLLVAGQAGVSTAGDSLAQISASCTIGTDPSVVRIELVVANGGEESVFEVTPGALMATGRGNALLFVESGPASLSVLSPGAEATFVWSGQAFGDGLIEFATSLAAQHVDGSEVRIESIDCGDLAVGDPDRPVPTRYWVPHPHRTQIPTATASHTPTPVPADPERCPGDCDGSGTVRLHELVTAIDIALGRGNVAACRAADANGDSRIEVDELTAVVRTSLFGCAVSAEAP